MKIEDFGFITLIKEYEENSLLIKILSKENGLMSGYVSHVKKQRSNYQIGNLIKFTWSAKNVDQLGTLRVELVKSYLSTFIGSRFGLYLIDCITSLINDLLYERYREHKLFQTMEVIFNLVAENAEKCLIVKEYLLFENAILNVVGTGIIFEQNGNMGKLYYVSPKTGLAVDKQMGDPYKDRLLVFPRIFKNEQPNRADIIECFYVMDFFLKKYLNNNDLSCKHRHLMLLSENILNSL